MDAVNQDLVLRRLWAWVLIAVVSLSAGSPPFSEGQPARPLEATTEHARDLYKIALPSVMTLSVVRSDGTRAGGTGFMAIGEGIAVTAYHVVRDARRVTARFSEGEEFDVSGMIDYDARRDVALIRVKVYGRPLLLTDAIEPEVGSRAYVIGAPLGYDFSLSEGLVSQVRPATHGREIQFTCAASPGNSGGPLLNSQARVIGVVSFQRPDGQNLNFAIPVAAAMGLDATLPTKPWRDAGQWSPHASAVAENDILDRALGRGLNLLADFRTAVLAADVLVVNEPGGFKAGVPAFLYYLEGEARAFSDSLASMRSDDTDREQARVDLLAAFGTSLEASALCTQAIREAQSNGGWSPIASDLFQRQSAVMLGGPGVRRAKWFQVRGSAAFAEAVDPMALQLSGLDGDSTTFVLGVCSWIRDPLALVAVVKNSVAERLGLRSGDRVVALDGGLVTSVDELKRRLTSLRGMNCRLTVVRDGETSTLAQRKVPSILPRY